MFHALQKTNIQTFYAKEKINLSWLYLQKENNYIQTCPKFPFADTNLRNGGVRYEQV